MQIISATFPRELITAGFGKVLGILTGQQKSRAMADSALVSVIYQSISWSYISSYSPGAMPQLRPMTLADHLKK